jgi:hypothetical protein
MKIISALLIVFATLLICISLAISSGIDLKILTASGDIASLDLIFDDFNLEPAMMIVIGTIFIVIAGIGRKKLLKKDSGDSIKKKKENKTICYPDPVPWKAEE